MNKIKVSRFATVKIVSFLWVSTIAGAGLGFLSQVILARSLGAESFGLFTSALGTVNLLLPLAGFGVASFWLKLFGQKGWNAVHWLPASFNFIALSSLAVMFSLFIWAQFGPHNVSTKTVISIFSILVFGHVTIELCGTKCQLEENYGKLALLQLLSPLGRFLLVLFIVLYDSLSIKNVAIGYALVSLLILLVCFLPLYEMRFGKVELKGHGASYIQKCSVPIRKIDVLDECWVFGVAGMFYFIWSQSHVVFIKYFSGDVDAGIYGVALILMNAICMLPAVIYSKYLMPKIHRWANKDLAQLKKVFYTGNKVMLLLGLVIMSCVLLFAEYVIVTLFSYEYKESIELLIILAFILPVRFVGHSVGAMLVAKENMKSKIKVMGGVAALNLILNFILISIWGVKGVAYASVICEIVLVSLYFMLVNKIYLKSNWKHAR